MKVNLEGQVALVTGGANGIGRAIVQALADNGADVVIVDIDPEAGAQAASEVVEAGGRCLSLEGDVSNLKQMERVVEKIVEQVSLAKTPNNLDSFTS